MSDDEPGAAMVCATKIMNPGQIRIGRIGQQFTLPRTVPVRSLFAIAIGAVVGVLFGRAIGGDSWVVSVAICSMLGWGVVTYSPLQNESLMKWFELKIRNRTRTRMVDGKRVITSVGGAVVTAPIAGMVSLRRAAVRVPAGQFDERGVPRSARNRNLDEVSAMIYGSGVVPEGARTLPRGEDGKGRQLRKAR